jgi:8-oxo-dGTP diphosphatase
MKSERAKRFWHLSVYALIRDRAGRILLLRRAAEALYFAGDWELPGGKLSKGEGIEAGLRREVREETGLDLCLQSVAGATDFQVDGKRIVCLALEGTAKRKRVRLSAEHDDMAWVTVDALAKHKLAPHFHSLKQWLSGPQNPRS